MAKETNETPTRKLSDPRSFRLYSDDDAAIQKLQEDTDADLHLDITDIIRDCIRAGLPIVEKKLRRHAT